MKTKRSVGVGMSAAVVAVGLVVAVPLARAADVPSGPSVDSPDRTPAEHIPEQDEFQLVPDVALGISTRVEAASRASFGDDGSRVGIGRLAGTISLRAPVADGTIVGVEVAEDVDLYDWSGGSGTFAGAAAPDGPFGTVSLTSFRGLVVKQIADDWAVLVIGTVEFSSEDASDWGGSVTGGGALAVRYQWTPSLAVTLGVVGHTRLEDDPFVLPFPGIEWHITDRLTLATAQGVSLAYDAFDARAWRFDVALGYEDRRFRLDSDGPFPRGIGEETRVPLSVGVAYRPFGLSLRAGAVTNSKVQVFDEEGHHLGTEHPADVALVAVALDLSL